MNTVTFFNNKGGVARQPLEEAELLAPEPREDVRDAGVSQFLVFVLGN